MGPRSAHQTRSALTADASGLNIGPEASIFQSAVYIRTPLNLPLTMTITATMGDGFRAETSKRVCLGCQLARARWSRAGCGAPYDDEKKINWSCYGRVKPRCGARRSMVYMDRGCIGVFFPSPTALRAAWERSWGSSSHDRFCRPRSANVQTDLHLPSE
jgi:hypothetical protein